MAEQKSKEQHLGHFILEAFAKRPDHVNQIDASSGARDTNASLSHRSISLARALISFGLKPGDVVTLSGRNHLDIRVPYLAALMVGCPIAGIDPTFKYSEIKRMLPIAQPKLSFCQQDSFEDTTRAVSELGLDTTVVTFEDGADSLEGFLQKYGGQVGEFVLPEFEPETTLAWLLSTSGTSGTPKLACYHHKQVLDVVKLLVHLFARQNSTSVVLSLSPVQWMSAYLNSLLSIATSSINVQTSAPATIDHVIDIINEYKPTTAMFSPSVLARQLLRHEKQCDLSCFRAITLTGSQVHRELMMEIRSRVSEEAKVSEMYGQTETLIPVLNPAPDGPLGNCGRLFPMAQAQLVDEAEQVIEVANKPGELWVKSKGFAGYYNMPEETKAAFSPDGWYKTGDILYRDEDGYYYYVERVKMLIKYKGHHILPSEIEAVLRSHPAVLEAAVTSVADLEAGELPAAGVVARPGGVTAEELQELVAEKLSDSKRLRGGVVFLAQLPLTSTGKVARAQLRDIVRNAERE